MGLLISTNIIANNKKKQNKLVNSKNTIIEKNLFGSNVTKEHMILDNIQNKNNTSDLGKACNYVKSIESGAIKEHIISNLDIDNNFILNDFDKILSFENKDK
jgi:hypothetical protein